MPNLFLENLFKQDEDKNLYSYALIDSARIIKLTNELTLLNQEQYEILFEGEDAFQLEEVAPYLVELKKEDEFTTWVAKNVYDRYGAIFIKSINDIETLAQHLKEFIHVNREVEFEGEVVTQKGYLAYYDPRVFPVWIESESQERQAKFFSNIEELLCEDEFKEHHYLSYHYNNELTIQTEKAYKESV